MKKVGFFIAFCLILPLSCKNEEGEVEVSSLDVQEMLYTVPSDAVGFMAFNKCAEGLEIAFDSTSVYRSLTLGKDLSEAPAAVSLHYDGRLISMLSIGTGETDPDSIATTAPLLKVAGEKGLKARLNKGESRNAILIGNNEALLDASERHIKNGANIMDARGAKDILKEVEGKKNFFIFPNKESGKLVGILPLPSGIKKRQFVSFMERVSEWTALVSKKGNKIFDVLTCQSDDKQFYINLLNSISCGKSALDGVLPKDCDYVISLQIEDIRNYIEAHDAYLDALTLLTSYKSTSSAIEKWAKECDIKEVAAVGTGEVKLVLVRPGKELSSMDIEDGWIASLFGDAFVLEDQSSCCKCGKFFVIGSASDVDSFLAGGEEHLEWTDGEKTKAVVYMSGKRLSVVDDSKMKLEIL